MAVTVKTMRDIRTLSGQVGQVAMPYRAYMRISCLEMERFRRQQEKSSASHRIAIINARMCEIEAEKDKLLRALNERSANMSAANPAGGASSYTSPTRAGASRGFKIRY